MCTKNSKNKIKIRSKIYGEAIGWNDADYFVTRRVNGKQVWRCPYYQAWVKMLERVFCPKYHAKYPTYKGTSVCPEWLHFMNFRAWMMTQEWEDKQLDKDLLYPGNKHYSPRNCIFVSQRINTLMNDCGANRGKHPIGVRENGNGYQARCNNDTGKSQNLGTFSTPEEAHMAYVDFKYQVIFVVAETVKDPELKRHLQFNAMIL